MAYQITPDLFVETALQYLGYPSTRFTSKRAPLGPDGEMDCSAVICLAADEIGLPRPISKFTERPVRTSREMFWFWGSQVTAEEARKGDLVYFSWHGAWPTHVGIYLENGLYFHSPGITDGVIGIARIDRFGPHRFKDTYYYDEKRGERFDVIFEGNPVGFNRIL